MRTQSELVELIFERIFGAHEDSSELRALLAAVGDPPSPRVQLGVLKLSGGEAEKLKEYIELARIDYRDVLAYAEYPEAMRAGPAKWKPGAHELDEIRRRDRAQYEAWLASFE